MGRLPLRRATAVMALGLAAGAVRAAAIVAVPYYTPQHYAQGLQRGGYPPLAAAFVAASAPLAPALQARCDGGALAPARDAWAASAAAWERLGTVALGPLLERRSARQIDFFPPRPELIARAIAAAPADAAALERIGSPAKGLPALEWLLWTEPVAPDSAACRYATRVAADIGREARALQDAWAALPEPDEAEAAVQLGEALNQWLAALETLRGRHLERPLRSEGGSTRDPAVYPRLASGRSAASWAAQWQALRRFAVAADGPAPVPGEGFVSFETYLRGRGLNPAADALRQRVQRADAALAGLDPARPEGLRAAVTALGELRREVENTVAPALNVSLGFSDADGD